MAGVEPASVKACMKNHVVRLSQLLITKFDAINKLQTLAMIFYLALDKKRNLLQPRLSRGKNFSYPHLKLVCHLLG